MLRILKPGIQATLQGTPRTGLRHLGIPYAGPADPLSMALANCLVSNALDATVIEITYGGFAAEVLQPCAIAITGADADLTVSDQAVEPHETLHLKTGDLLDIAQPSQGMRVYLAINGGFEADIQFGSPSTYLPAGFGGLDGRALRSGDQLAVVAARNPSDVLQTPIALRPVFTNSFALRACTSAETGRLSPQALKTLFEETFTAGRQGTRMGIALEGHTLDLKADGLMKSAAVYPGTIQCPPSGIPVALLCDAQTTGGYPRIAHIARCDRHLLGQIRPGDHVRLLHRSHDAAVSDLAVKNDFLKSWLPNFEL